MVDQAIFQHYYRMGIIPSHMSGRKGRRTWSIWVAGIWISFFMGCTAVVVGPKHEPVTLIVRNNSGAWIESVTLRATGSTGRAKGRYGTIAPVPLGASQVYLRPESAPPLPKRLLVSWITGDGRSHARELSLVQAIKSNQNPKADAMVFEILPGELVNIYMEVYSVSR